MRTIEPTLSFAPELLLRARGPGAGIRAAIFDVDGVLTDGTIYMGEHGEVVKAFSTLDGHGLKLLARGGILPLVVTGRDSPGVRRRIADLGIEWDALAVMGDDWPDLPLLVRAAFACAPPNAHVEVRAIADHVTRAHAGFGAARECCDLLLTAAGRYAELLRADPITLDRAG